MKFSISIVGINTYLIIKPSPYIQLITKSVQFYL